MRYEKSYYSFLFFFFLHILPLNIFGDTPDFTIYFFYFTHQKYPYLKIRKKSLNIRTIYFRTLHEKITSYH